MEKDKMRFLQTNIDFADIEPLDKNPMISKVKIKIAEPGRNRNGSIIRKSVLLKGARETLGMAPIVGYYSNRKGDFGEHGMQVDGYDEYDKSANIVDTQAFGAIPEKPEVFWEDGFLTTYGYVWTERFPFLYDALKNGKGHSMELDPKRLIVGEKTLDGFYDFEQIAFKGLCILGDEIPPAFANSSISLSGKRKDPNFSQEDSVNNDIKDLFFSLQQDNNQPDFLVENLTREQLEAYVNRITNTINELDKVADESESDENVAILDSIITKLVAIEKELQGEPVLTPVSDDAIEALKGENQDKDGIVSTSYKEEDKKGMTEEEKRKLQEAREAKKEEKNEVESTDNVDESEKTIPQENEKEVVENGESETESSETETTNEEELSGGEAEDKGTEVSSNDKPKRQGANVKRAEANLTDTATEDILAVLINRIGKADEAKSMLLDAFDIDITENSEVSPADADPATLDETEPQIIEGETPQTSSEVSDGTQEETVEKTSETTDAIETTDEEDNKEQEAEDQPEPTDKKEDEKEQVEESSGQQEISEEATSEDDKNKKREFALRELADGAEALIAENKKLKDKLTELENFKANVEKEEKEKALSSFSISEEEKEKIRTDFSSLSVENVMEKAALVLYQTSSKEGQKNENADIEFSLPIEEGLNVEDSRFSGILKAIKEIQD